VYTGPDFGPPFEGLTQGGHELHDISGELRFRAVGEKAVAPYIALGAGGYHQSIHGARVYPVHLGWHLAFGGMGLGTVGPGAEFRFDWIDSTPAPSFYFTASAALHLNR